MKLTDDPVGPLQHDLLRLVPVAASHRALQAPIMAAVQVREDAVLVGELSELCSCLRRRRPRRRVRVEAQRLTGQQRRRCVSCNSDESS